MQVTQAIRAMCADSGLTHRQIAHRLGRYDTYVSQMITRGTDPQTTTLADLARACGYRLELVPIADGTPIVIGDDEAPTTDVDALTQARALIARAAALLEDVAG